MLNSQALPPVADPTDADLEAYLKEHQANFRTRETRSVELLVLTPETLAATKTIPEDQIAAEYERTKDSRTKEERRSIKQIVLNTPELEKAFADGKAAGKPIGELLAETGAAFTDLGTLSKNQVTDPKLAEAAFGLAVDDYAIIEGIGGKRVITVSAIEPGGVVSLADAHDEIARQLALKEGRDEINDVLDQVEELRAAFKPLPEIGERFGLKTYDIAVTPGAPELASQPDISPQDRDRIATAIFKNTLGDLAPTISLGSNRNVWFDLKKVDPARDQTLDEVRDAVATAWTNEKTAEALAAEVTKLTDQLKAGTAFADVAASINQFPTLSPPLMRDGTTLINGQRQPEPVLSQSVVSAIFNGGPDHFGSAVNSDGDHVIFQVADVTPAAEARARGPAVHRELDPRCALRRLRQRRAQRDGDAHQPAGPDPAAVARHAGPVMGDDQFGRFASAYDAGRAQIVFRRVVADLETPIGAYLKLAEGRKNTFLLESVQGGATRGRYSMIGFDPDVILKVEQGKASINRNAGHDPEAFTPIAEAPLDALRALVAESQADVPPGLPSTAAGIYGYLGYEMVRLMEVLPDRHDAGLGFPDAILMRPTVLAVFDTLKDELYLTAPVYVRPGVTARQAWEGAQSRIDDAVGRLGRTLPYTSAPPKLDAIAVKSNTTPAEYARMVEEAKEYIRAGDIFQVVLSQRFEAEFTLPPTALYRALRRTNPSPYMYMLDFGDFAVAGSSPEILVKVEKGQVTIRPDRRDPEARRDADPRQGTRRRTAQRSQGAGRAPDAARPRSQRRRPGLEDR